jgi:hypothetical protein
MKHPHLSDEVNDKIEQSERDGGIWLKNVRKGETITVRTANSTYTIIKTGDDDYTIQGNNKYCPVDTPCKIHGSTWGGSMLKIGYVGRGMHLEFSTKEQRTVTTTTIRTIKVDRVH